MDVFDECFIPPSKDVVFRIKPWQTMGVFVLFALQAMSWVLTGILAYFVHRDYSLQDFQSIDLMCAVSITVLTLAAFCFACILFIGIWLALKGDLIVYGNYVPIPNAPPPPPNSSPPILIGTDVGYQFNASNYQC